MKTTAPIPFAGSELGEVRHVCAFFNSAEEQYRVLLPFITDGFECGHKAVHVVNPGRHQEHLQRLTAAGIDTAATQASGQLELRTNVEAYLRNGRFDQDRMLADFEKLASGNDARGFPLSRIVCQMDWAADARSHIDNLVEFESRVNEVWCRHEDAVICVYDLAKFGGDTVIDILRTHPMVIIGGILQPNPFYVPPEQFLRELREPRAEIMEVQDEQSAREVKRLQRCLNDLVSMLALPALWSGGEPSQIARTLIDVLQRMLHLELIYVRLNDPKGDAPIEMARVAESPVHASDPGEIGAELFGLLGDDSQKWPSRASCRFGDEELSIVPVRMGLHGELGLLVAGAGRSDFPGQTEDLLLRTAANQAVMALHEARLRDEQKRLADELDERVAQRTVELAAANQRLRESELNLRQMTETIPEMLWSATPDGAIDYCNARLLDYTGFAFDEIIGNGWTKLIHPDDVEAAACAWMSCVASGAPYRVEVRTIHVIDRTYRWCVATARPLLDKDGRILKWHGTVVDMHDWKQAQEALRNTQADLASMMRIMTMAQLTASIAHEVNQPLSGIITNAGTCLRMLDADPPNVEGARETARRTIRDGNRASEVVTRLRALFSKRQATSEPVDLNEAAREVIALLSSKLQRNRVVLRSELADDLPLVTGDRVQLQQVIMNLLQNASDAMSSLHDRSRELLIQTERDDADHVRLTVQDSGVGLDPQDAIRLFNAFYTTKNGGMGIGLSVSRSIIESHQGRIWAKPNDGPGATFSFSIPRSPGSAIGERLLNSAQKLAAGAREVVRKH